MGGGQGQSEISQAPVRSARGNLQRGESYREAKERNEDGQCRLHAARCTLYTN